MIPTAILGVDEAGMGPSAGPLVVAAFFAPDPDWAIEGLTDSKDLTENERTRFYNLLRERYEGHFTILFVGVAEINAYGIHKAHAMAMAQAATMLINRMGIPDRVIFDGNVEHLPGSEAIPQADAKFQAVSAASVLAKVSRDNYVCQELHPRYPRYGLDSHKGYWTPEHKAAVIKYGVEPDIHRTKYKNIRELMTPQQLQLQMKVEELSARR